MCILGGTTTPQADHLVIGMWHVSRRLAPWARLSIVLSDREPHEGLAAAVSYNNNRSALLQ